MEREHIVVQGDHVSGLADHYGLGDFNVIWNHPKNAALKKKRKDPNILFPGDVVVIPEIEQRTEQAQTDRKYVYQTCQPNLFLSLELNQTYNRPLANKHCDLLIDFDHFAITTDSSGGLETKISPEAKEGLLIVKDQITVKGKAAPIEFQVPVRIGHLNPVEEPSGQMMRLANLGYYRLEGDDIDVEEFRSAVEEFQCEAGLLVDGICGPQTQASLKAAHGC